MHLGILRKEIEADEGCKYETYLCSQNKLTGGIGHLILGTDAVYDKPIGSSIPEEQVLEWFTKDVQFAIDDCHSIFKNFDDLPEDIQHVLVNMAFQLGGPRLRKFKNMIAAVNDSNWEEAAAQMEDSRWYKQTTNRATRLIDRIIIIGVPA